MAGRLEPGVAAIEALARCVFYAAPGELAFAIPDDKGKLRYGIEERAIQFRDGTELPVPVAVHPDARVQAVLEQVREAELLQAVARIRPVHRRADQSCEIIVATNVPLPGLLVDEGVEWNDLAPDRMRRMELAGVLPDLAADCVAAYPDLFASAAAVRQARSRAARARLAVAGSDIDLGCDKAHLSYLYGKCHTPEGATAPSSLMTSMGMIRVEYKRPVGSLKGNREGSVRAGGAFVRCHPGESESEVVARLLNALPDAVQVAVVGSIPCPVARPDEAQAALGEAVGLIEPWLDTDDVLARFPIEVGLIPGALLGVPLPMHGGDSCYVH